MILVPKGNGWFFEIHSFEDSRGKIPVEEFLDSIEEKVTLKFFALFVRMAEIGRIENPDQFEVFKGEPLFEFKNTKPNYRILGFHSSKIRGLMVLTHGFTKKTKKTPPGEIKLAKKRMEEYEKRN